MLQIHSKKRNRLDHKKLHNMVYVKYNQKLKERHNARDEIDPIRLNDIAECNEWFVGEMNDAGNELVLYDDSTKMKKKKKVQPQKGDKKWLKKMMRKWNLRRMMRSPKKRS